MNRPEAGKATNRSLAYNLLAQILEYPRQALYDQLPELVDRLAEITAGVDPELASAGFWSLDPAGFPLGALQDEYTRLFDVGRTGRPPCPLMGSSYAGAAKMRSMEEALRFYNHFGLMLNQQQKAMPDQLGTELEFLHYLSYRQAEQLEQGEEAAAFRRAERDFLSRELLFWVPKMNAEMRQISDAAFYGPLCEVLELFLRASARG